MDSFYRDQAYRFLKAHPEHREGGDNCEYFTDVWRRLCDGQPFRGQCVDNMRNEVWQAMSDAEKAIERDERRKVVARLRGVRPPRRSRREGGGGVVHPGAPAPYHHQRRTHPYGGGGGSGGVLGIPYHVVEDYIRIHYYDVLAFMNAAGGGVPNAFYANQ